MSAFWNRAKKYVPRPENWRDSISAVVFAMLLTGLAAFWSFCAPFRDAFWNFYKGSHVIPGWLLMSLLLTATPTLALVWNDLSALIKGRPAYQKNYRSDSFDAIRWEWFYSKEGKLQNLVPYCETCSTRLMLDVSEQKLNDKSVLVTNAYCTTCNKGKGFVNVSNLSDHVERKIEQRIRTKTWNTSHLVERERETIRAIDRGTKLIMSSVSLREVEVSPKNRRITLGDSLEIKYIIESLLESQLTVWLGANLFDPTTKEQYAVKEEDIEVVVQKGLHSYQRRLTISPRLPVGIRSLRTEIWYGPVSQPRQSFVLDTCWPTCDIAISSPVA